MKVVSSSKRILQVASFLVCNVVAFSAVAADGHKASLQTLLNQLKSFSAEFTQEVKDVNGELLQKTQGKIKLQQPQKLYWEVLPPNEGILVADGKTLWHVDPFVEQVVAMDQSNAVQDHPIMLLAEPNSALWSRYEVDFSNGDYVVYPQSQQQSVKQFRLRFNEQGTLSTIQIIDQQDQSNLLEFSQVKANARIPKSTFEFTLPEGFDLDDQR